MRGAAAAGTGRPCGKLPALLLTEWILVLEIIRAGGWIMWPLMAASIVALAIIIERSWTLRSAQILPPGLSARALQQLREGKFGREQLAALRESSPLGFVLSAAVANARQGRAAMQAAVDTAGGQVVHEMERFLTTLGALASVATLLGLLGSVIGMIEIFNAVSLRGTGDPTLMAKGISVALIATASGLMVAIPAQFFHRILMRRVDDLAIRLETEVMRFVDVVTADRQPGDAAREAA